MFLKSVEMIGFKSFADKIYLDFNPGITAIVGPNGSGKSNISDAIRWVMGEQSIKTLRGSRMEDVIFAGSEKRKPQGFAEVSLTLDNSERIISLDFDEITVTRRVYRSGEGEYFINKAPCRLKDIHELFMDTGLGREGYSIIGQGKIDEILSNKSEDRREIFEEAAGITKYKYRKNEAERKLEKTNDNLLRVRDIMTELEGQLEPLRIQSEKAKKYLGFREELKTAEVNVSVTLIDKLKKEIEKVDGDLKAVLESINTLTNEADDIENVTKEMYEQIAEFEERLEACRENQKANAEETNEKNNQINLLNSDIKHCQENIERIMLEIQKSERGIEQLDALVNEYVNTIEKLKNDSIEIENKKISAEKEFNEKNSIFESDNENIEELKSIIIEKSSEINTLKSKIANYSILIDNFKSGYEKAKAELDTKKDDFESLSSKNKQLKGKLTELEQTLDIAKKNVEKTEDEYKQISDATRYLSSRKNAILAELSQKTSRHGVLEDMENDFEGYNRSVKSVMMAYKHGNIKNAKIHGPLSALISTEQKYVIAIETALASVSQNIVTDNEQDAKAAIEYLKENKLGRATFMPISTIKARIADVSMAQSMKGYIAIAEELVSYDDIYEKIVKNTLGTTVVVDNIDNAIAMAKKCNHRFKIVTLEGDVMQAGGAMSGGSNKNNSGFLSRASEIELLKTEIAKLEETLKEINVETEKNAIEFSKLEEKLVEERNTVSSINTKYITLKADFEHSERYFSDFNKEREQLIDEMSTIEERINEINNDIEKSNNEIIMLEKDISNLKAEIDSKQNETESLAENVHEIQELLIKISIDKNAVLKDIEIQQERLDGVRKEQRAIFEEKCEKQQAITEISDKITETKAKIQECQTKLEEISKNSVETDRELEELADKRRETDLKTKDYQKRVKEINEQLFGLGQQKVKIESLKTKAEADLDGIFEHLWDEYELTYTEAVKLKGDVEVNIKETKRLISELKGKIKALGNVNVDAIEEYKDVKERFEFLTSQTEDLEKAKAELEKIIDDMLKIMEKQFSEQFSIISRNFNSVFKELFGGGQANLSLANPSDLLGSGIEIEAQPPGKKLQSLTLLSGGERAFTAIALLFAILKVKPTSFCILDEIEAALDDVNVYRYADYLKKYCKKTQFIVVTHRRGTMEAANILYGVTMQEGGISKLLSLNIDEVTE